MPLLDYLDRPNLVESCSLESTEQPTVAIIGCGPGGMSFLHALAHRRQKLENAGDDDGIARLPIVTCYEMSSSPGGVWKSNEGKDTSTNMYQGLWINGHKEAQEYFDYSYDDHFKCAVPAYQPRSQILEYMLARATSIEDIFQYVKFDTTVTSVHFDETRNLFDVTDIKNETGKKTTLSYDKCIWSGGINGTPNVPSKIEKVLLKQCFEGHIFHSSEMSSFCEKVSGKRVVLVGDSYSAEDLALQLIKLGVEKIYIISRRGEGAAAYIKSWPEDKVKLLEKYAVCGVTSDKAGIVCSRVKCLDDDNDKIEIPDIFSIIFCTGYEPKMDYLSDDLCEWNDEGWYETWSTPADWKSKENILSSTLADVEPSEILTCEHDCHVIDGLYNHHLMSNPDMMFMFETSSHPLLDIDILAWCLLAYVCGDVTLPTFEKMEEEQMAQRLEKMDISDYRYSSDKNYAAACDNIHKDHWIHEYSSDNYLLYEQETIVYEHLILARRMIIGNYPLKFGTKDKLNVVGEKSVKMCTDEGAARYRLNPDDPDSSWKTFRDQDPTSFQSLITGTIAAPLKGHWMDLDDDGNLNNK
uniref:Uncharacterized protein n=1 Tax=Eucampia antarctica TaxID=49252 RepID=A0A7S2SGE8_9STRA|mmetsp:Transcript_7898/g.7495  ORF Transcript_7898/g.7495 Transcript_7898/m.7495 type:complete len:581 (+) Transcript_7898:71-1813(+)|eukprot:CAMPEP_0197836796 /NCGR_PEP_ID=MMETSP1437-20131217/30028_1 /TAXON_ID=49252 ORGANISM="Eucampia antarctica, Strain CCMP1452" /NCGR_SAMPLE_ID=MMETSP1437 /ASSEMBLY_ACC=CAM_ASM_001096 /LENGTH=580 /DNA_ID=CAMNT_0043443255 /DNA_START=60 /DNA_END=1802 /DNA_ORIENTATION=-